MLKILRLSLYLSIVDAIVLATSKATNSTIVTSDDDFLIVKGVKVKKLDIKFDDYRNIIPDKIHKI